MHINYFAPSLTELDQGYGRMAYAMLHSFKSAGVMVSHLFDPSRITLIVGIPDYALDVRSAKRKWLYTMIESNRMAESWVKSINVHYERVIVPSPCQVQYLQESGVTVPVHYIPLGCDLYMPHLTKERQYPTDSAFTFLTYSYGDNRKGSELAVSAFLSLYDGDASKHLVIKARDSYDVQWLKTLSKHPQIDIVGGVISNAHWMHLLENAHCFVFPSRAEGYGLPPREATVSECPTIATRWLGMWDIDQWGYGIDVEQLAPVYFDNQTNNAPDAQWAHPSMESIQQQMQLIVNDYDGAIRKARHGREYLLSHNTWQGCAMAIRHLLGRYA